jgi:hypothetical protein
MDGFDQRDKDVSKIGEVTHTINRYEVDYVEGYKYPTISIETRAGQFEYVFLYCDFIRKSKEDMIMPTKQPVISAIQYKVFGRENRFVRELDTYDLERLSRDNCTALSDWRTFHEEGRGVLLHLSDLGLTEEVPFPRRGRMHIEFTLLKTRLPDIETSNIYTTEDIVKEDSTHTRRFTVCLLRNNQLLKGDIRDIRFTFLNEEV